jgi:hypothetical protein
LSRSRHFGGRLLSRRHAFEAHGVALKYPSRSMSGVVPDDGEVILALSASQVVQEPDGYGCLLWSPRPHRVVDRAADEERLAHCRLACLHGRAHGLLAYGDRLRMNPDEVLQLRISQEHDEYWARWGRSQDERRLAA